MQLAHRRAHRRIWIGLSLLLPAILVLSLVLRQSGPDPAPLRLAPPEAPAGR